METEKTKDKGDVRKSTKIIANGITFKNGNENIKHYKIPLILLDYKSPKSAKDFAKGERFCLWAKLEESQYKKVEEQMKKDLREIGIWLDEENLQKLKEFLNLNKMEVKQ